MFQVLKLIMIIEKIINTSLEYIDIELLDDTVICLEPGETAEDINVKDLTAVLSLNKLFISLGDEQVGYGRC